jgi:hypothetical protein
LKPLSVKGPSPLDVFREAVQKNGQPLNHNTKREMLIPDILIQENPSLRENLINPEVPPGQAPEAQAIKITWIKNVPGAPMGKFFIIPHLYRVRHSGSYKEKIFVLGQNHFLWT